MSPAEVSGPEPFWKTVRLIWKSARRRAAGRRERQRQLMRQRKARSSGIPNGLAIILTVIVGALLHGFLGQMTAYFVESGALVATEHAGQMMVNARALDRLEQAASRKPNELELREIFHETARQRAQILGGTSESQNELLRNRYEKLGTRGFVRWEEIGADLSAIGRAPPLARLCGTVLFLCWFVMLVMQGEGLELDVQRRRHPIWEWLLSHPLRPEAAFLAEMVSPLVANAIYYTAPIYWIVLLARVFPLPVALGAGLALGFFFALAAACLNKTLELCAMLKLSVRSRGAVLGLMSWLGYALMIVPFFLVGNPGILTALAFRLAPLASIFHPDILGWLLGAWAGNNPSALLALVASFATAAALVIACALVGKWGTAAGLEGGFENAPRQPRLLDLSRHSRFGREPLHRKELLWFLRDRSALIQAVLIPLTIAAVQAINLRHAVQAAGHSWNAFCGFAIISGTYFLIVLGPKSLASEGPALWITMTWPRGLEDLLKAKARLWWILSTTIVFAILIFAASRFPADLWRIALVAAGWWIFGRSLADKAVTLVSAPSSSGEAEPIPRHRQWTALLGTLAFGSGVLTKNWHLAIIGVVFSSLTAAAMWQNLRARLPFLFDPWSEKLPPAPTLLHAMVAIAALAEGVGLTTAIIAGIAGRDSLNLARTIAYGIGALATFLIMQEFLKKRGVRLAQIWRWERTDRMPERDLGWTVALASGLFAGGMLGLCAVGYRQVVLQLPAIQEFIRQHPEFGMGSTHHFWWLALLLVGFAPLAEEFLFRGLLYRALDREWGGWHALLGSAAFFAIYHPPFAWLPVGLLGLLNAWLFKTTGRLAPCVLSHMAYNAAVVLIR